MAKMNEIQERNPFEFGDKINAGNRLGSESLMWPVKLVTPATAGR
jgi:hypothetical protein